MESSRIDGNRAGRPTAGFQQAILCLAACLVAACAVGPNYKRPLAETPEAYKKNGLWRPANPRDDMIRGKWWEIYHDPQLNALEEQVNISNQNVLMNEAQFFEAAAATKVARAALFPTISASPSYNESKSSSSGRGSGVSTGTGTTVGTGTTTGSGATTGSGTTGSGGTTTSSSGAVVSSTSPANFYELPVNATYVVDVWGAVRRNVRANSRTAQATFADLENARLSYQSTLAEDYFMLLGLDAEKQLLQTTLDSYQKYLTLTQNRYNGGIASQGDVATAQAQLDATRVQLIDLGVNRAQYEDAIAMLIGQPAPAFGIRYKPLHAVPPKIPAGVPSELLQRRPDIAAAERRVASANETIGVNVAGYYPQLTLTATTGTEAIQFSQLFSGPSFFWSLGPALAQTIFDAGKTHGQVQEARASYQAAVATYRQTVLTAFQQVEDNLAALRVLRAETTAEESAVSSAQKSLEVATNQYKAGTEDYLFVITAQAIALNDEINAVNLRTREMAASVLLVQALGGGWDISHLPGAKGVADVPPAEKEVNKAKPKGKGA
jgi:NodT family efflux transporter outer membrane factor (OMF) lipoprotein